MPIEQPICEWEGRDFGSAGDAGVLKGHGFTRAESTVLLISCHHEPRRGGRGICFFYFGNYFVSGHDFGRARAPVILVITSGRTGSPRSADFALRAVFFSPRAIC
jgi:hypothetical protein